MVVPMLKKKKNNYEFVSKLVTVGKKAEWYYVFDFKLRITLTHYRDTQFTVLNTDLFRIHSKTHKMRENNVRRFREKLNSML